jgi:hypothetical protein
MPDKITLSMDLVNQIMGYLSTKPFAEVYQLIQAVQQETQDQISPADAAAK